MSEEELREYCKNASLEISNMQHTIDKYKKEIDKLTAESTEWEERTYCWQDRAENLQIVLDKIKELDINDDDLKDVIFLKENELSPQDKLRKIKELLEEIE